MAESFVQVTEGAGKKLHTYQRVVGANTVEDEIVLLGENYLASYTVVAVNPLTTTLNSHILQIMAGAALKVRIRRIEITQSILATAVAFMGLAVFRLTTAGTGGGAVTPNVLDTGDGAAGATAMTLPTVKGTETQQITQHTTYMMQTLAASTPYIAPTLVLDFDRPRSKPLIIPAGATNGIAIKNTVAVAAGGLQITVWLDESNF